MYNPYNTYRTYPYPHYITTPMYTYSDETGFDSRFNHFLYENNDVLIKLKDYGPRPFVVNIEEATRLNNTYRTALWTGTHLQLTLMNIKVGEDIGLEVHENLDQFVRIEEGKGIVKMGDSKYKLDFQRNVSDNFAFIIPAGKWHNLINTGNTPLKLYSIYAPPQHPYGTVHETKADADNSEKV